MPRHQLPAHTPNRPLIYRVVFGLVYTKWLVAVMFGFFLLNPAVPVFAAEPEVADAAVADEESITSQPEIEPTEEAEVVAEVEEPEAPPQEEVVEAVEEITPEVQHETVPDNEPDVSPETEGVPIADATTTPAVVTEPAASTTPEVVGTSTAPMSEPLPTESETGTSTEPVPEVTPEPVIETPAEAPVSQPEIIDETPEEAATTTEKEIIYVIDGATTDANRHSFSTEECVSVGGGSYYCSKAGTDAAALTEDAVYAAPDAEGDHEIYFRHDGEITQVTHNNFDDRSPYHDARAEEIVFHRLIDGRYQIIRYDVVSEDETQLTDTKENSMEPTQADGITVWQEWVTDNWEIAALIDGEVRFLSDNIHNDVAPSIKDGYVLWHTMDATGQKLLSVYEMETGLTSLIADPDGGQVSNPRFVLVYDTTFDNGDMVTKTYDPETGAIEPISSQPWDRPVIPDPEPGGETGAIINLKPTTRDDGGEEGDLLGVEPVTAGDGNASTTEPTQEENVFEIDLSETRSEPLTLTDFDLIVEPFNGSSSVHTSDSAAASGSVE